VVNGQEVTKYYFSTSPNMSGIITPPLATQTETLNIAPGGQYTEQLVQLTVPDLPQAYYWLIIQIDADQAINPSDTDNFVEWGPIAIYPQSPLQPIASQGTHPRHVQISWNTDDLTSTFQVLRSTEDILSTAEGISSFNSYINGDVDFDKTAVPGVIYYYWVIPESSGQGFPAQGPAVGYIPLPAPTDDVAGEPQQIQITWAAVTNAGTYQVFRSTTDDIDDATRIAHLLTSLLYDDADVAPGITYYYWVRAKDSNGTVGVFSPVESAELT
jgi:hypothetical protein